MDSDKTISDVIKKKVKLYVYIYIYVDLYVMYMNVNLESFVNLARRGFIYSDNRFFVFREFYLNCIIE